MASMTLKGEITWHGPDSTGPPGLLTLTVPKHGNITMVCTDLAYRVKWEGTLSRQGEHGLKGRVHTTDRSDEFWGWATVTGNLIGVSAPLWEFSGDWAEAHATTDPSRSSGSDSAHWTFDAKLKED